MVCPVCVAGGIGYVLCRFLGFPEVVMAFVLGMLATSTAYWVNHEMGKKWKRRKGQLVALNILSGIMFLGSLKLFGLW